MQRVLRTRSNQFSDSCMAHATSAKNGIMFIFGYLAILVNSSTVIPAAWMSPRSVPFATSL